MKFTLKKRQVKLFPDEVSVSVHFAFQMSIRPSRSRAARAHV